MTRPTSTWRARRGVLLLVAAVLHLGACTTEGASEHLDRAARSHAVLADAVAQGGPGCSAAVGVEGTVVWAGARGVADLATGAEITMGTAFDIASVSKQFTATAILLLAEAGRLSLDQTLSTHVAGLPAWASTVTVAQLMHQTSGIPDYIGLLVDLGYSWDDRTTNADAVRVLAGVPELQFEPGTQFEYSNSNYLLLGEIVERVAGQPLSTVLADRIFEPLGLAMVLDPTRRAADEAVSYERADGRYTNSPSAWEQVGDGSIKTAPSQLVRWADNYRTGQVGGPKLLEAQLAGAVATDPDSGDRYGAGIYLYADGTLGHDGTWAGFVTDFGISADRRTSVAVSCNTEAHDPTAIADALAQVWG